MLAEIGATEGLIFLAVLVVFVWTLVTAARRGRWGWFVLILLVPGITTLLFWLFNPRPVDRGPRPV
jgi:hypothetical protein